MYIKTTLLVKNTALLLLLAIGLSWPCQSKTIFKCINEKGEIVFTNVDCPNNNQQELLTVRGTTKDKKDSFKASFGYSENERDEGQKRDDFNLTKSQGLTYLGMKKSEFLEIWKYFQGKGEHKHWSYTLDSNKTQSIYGTQEQFILKDGSRTMKYFYFRDGNLTTISE